MNARLESSGSPPASHRLSAVTALIAALLIWPTTTRAETVFNITGVGCVSNYVLQQGVIGSGCFGPIDQGFSMTGTVTVDVHGTPDGFNVGPASAYGTNWVRSSYQIQWTGPASGSYDGQLSGVTSFERYAEVYNEIGYGQELYLSSLDIVDDGPNQASTYAYLIRITDPMNGSWLSDLSFVESAGLAPGPNATNWLFISRLSKTRDPETGENLAVGPGSLSGTFIVTSMTAVPEPGIGVQSLAGVAILGLLFRRRSGGLS